ncbi:helix-turn-helix transcriptional regulator [Sphingomonas sp. TREG-RG-20F-R18-01]|uniref:helix-turn-helix domain-containing protein n=1 Tax=Sphingomonas sp. TREG-RG-20F-R18-01 TaxID=2914982 RepID=UPI001F5A2EEA|nr:helix-turn-helix transcriptional regulator [Sphingomonas sp. TREG-RG-20F-R18-01]
MTPGNYIRKRREAAGLTVDELALRLETIPAVSAMTRAQWLTMMETDVAPISISAINAIVSFISLDETVLDALALIRAGVALSSPQICIECGCSEHDPCCDEDGKPTCWWISEELCSCCVPLAGQAIAQ